MSDESIKDAGASRRDFLIGGAAVVSAAAAPASLG
jgi:hypothetical protein